MKYVLLALALALSFSACGSGQPVETQSTAPAMAVPQPLPISGSSTNLRNEVAAMLTAAGQSTTADMIVIREVALTGSDDFDGANAANSAAHISVQIQFTATAPTPGEIVVVSLQ